MGKQLEKIHYQSCPVCSSILKHWKTKDTSIVAFNIDICKSCGYAFINPRPSFQYLRNFYPYFKSRGQTKS